MNKLHQTLCAYAKFADAPRDLAARRELEAVFDAICKRRVSLRRQLERINIKLQNPSIKRIDETRQRRKLQNIREELACPLPELPREFHDWQKLENQL